MEDRARLVSVFERARAGGARAAEVLRVERSVLDQTASRARPVATEDVAWTVRVYLEGGRTGTGEGPKEEVALSRALERAAAAPEDPLAGPAERMPVRTGGLGIDDHRHAGIGEEDRVEILVSIERAFQQGGVRARSLRYRQVRDRRAWMSTRGVEASESATTYEVSADATLGDVEASARIASRHFSDVASLPFGPELRRRLEGLARRAAWPAQPVPLVLEPRVMADLARSLAPAFAADVVSGGGFLANWLGKRLASPTLHITDDAGMFGGLHTRAFDDRGVPPIAVTLLKEGVVHGLYHDPETARAAGLRPTGHRTAGALRPSNLVVRPGARTRNVIVAELKDFLVLDHLPPIDLASGRMRGVVPLVVVTGGERSGAVKGAFDIAIPELLGAIQELAADQERSCEVDTPTAVFRPGIVAPA
jgi:predicted Zn-dependent protease